MQTIIKLNTKMNQPLQLSLFDSAPQFKTIAEKTGTFTDNMKIPVHRWFRRLHPQQGYRCRWLGSSEMFGDN